ncbi:ABC transporter permease [Gehongia tenuis]|uniref:ABC transporter permease subunit n=1 Tax=Gehongia tenuis TaxID=2763655 RepID=A0A926D7X9_9FIRM|nr:ABC transporter permease subunit [Gehongia tenuis]MBC8532035.1 ABC transporter permease subunit [Gehongia tenuis]
MTLKGLGKKIIVILLWVLVWQVTSMAVNNPMLVSSPWNVLTRLGTLMGDGAFYQAALASIFRIILGFLMGVTVGTGLALLTSFVPALDAFFRPAISAVKATPVASFIILALVWLHGAWVPVFIAFLMVLPIVWTNVTQGLRETDPGLLEMGRVFGLSRKRIFTRIYMPSALPYFLAACRTALGLAWKAGIAAEVLGTTALSIGLNLYEAKIYLETADVFAWTLVVIILSMIFEYLFGRLMNRLAARYQ